MGFVAPFKFSPLNLPFAAPFKLEVRPEPAGNSFAGAPKTGRVQSAPAATTRSAPHLHMGRRPQGRRPEAADGPTGHGAASAAPRTSRRVPGARHPARATTHPLAASRTDVRGGAHGHLAFVARALSRAALLRAKRSRAPDRRSRDHDVRCRSGSRRSRFAWPAASIARSGVGAPSGQTVTMPVPCARPARCARRSSTCSRTGRSTFVTFEASTGARRRHGSTGGLSARRRPPTQVPSPRQEPGSRRRDGVAAP